MKDLMNVKSKENPLPKKIPGYTSVLGFCQICLNSWLFLLFTNHLINIPTKFYTFCISPVLGQHNNVKKVFHKALF